MQSEENTRRDERFELELRALVGEYDQDHAQGSMAACDEAIGRLSDERGGLEHELGRITEVLALVAPPPPPEPEPVPVVNEEAPLPADEPPAGAESRSEAHAERDADATQADASANVETNLPPAPSPIDELAFLKSVVETPREELRQVQGDRLPQQTPRSEGGADLLPPPVLTAPRRPVTPLSSSIQPNREPLGGSTSSSILTPGSMPAFLKDMPTEQVKTLKCQECGTMNYPTEWYCERCGGELAAM